jgi:hypothetical protein
MTEPANEARTAEDPPAPEGATITEDGDEDLEDLEFLLDDIEDQIAPLGL